MKGKGKLLAVSAVVVVALVIVGFTVPVVGVPYEVTVETQGIETYTVQEPYETTETYTVQEPYIFQEPHIVMETYQDTVTTQEALQYQYNVVSDYTETGSYNERRRIVLGGVVIQDKIVTVYYPIACLDVMSFGTSVGTYQIKVKFKYVNIDTYLMLSTGTVVDTSSMLFSMLCREIEYTKAVTINPNDRLVIKFECKGIDPSDDAYKWEYKVVPDTYYVTHSEIVEKTRPITIYKPVTRYQTVEKTRTVTKYSEAHKTRPVTIPTTETRYKKTPLILSWFD